MSTPPTDYQEFEEFRGRRFLFAAGHFDYFSGAEKQAVYFAGELVRHLQADVKFIGWGGDGRFANEVRKVGAVPVVFHLDPGGEGWSHRLQLFRLARFIRRELQPEFLLPYVWMHCRIIGSIWEWTGARFCWWNQRDEGRGIEGTRLERRLMNHLPAVVSNSWEGRDFLTRKFQLREDRVQVVNNGVLIPERGVGSSFRQQNGISKNAVLLAMLANLSKYKDHNTLIRAFSLACKQLPDKDIHLVLAGSHGDAGAAVKALAWDMKIWGRLHMPGALEDCSELLEDTDLIVHSSLTEGCPNGVLEPMAYGLCILGTDISGMRQAIGMDNARLCLAPPGDLQGLADLIVKLVANQDERKNIGRSNLKRIVEHFSIRQMVVNSLRIIQRGCVH
jgi:glycosyltransferase involved in cell wall biosynthesis